MGVGCGVNHHDPSPPKQFCGVNEISDMPKTNDGYYEAYWPRGPRQQKTRALAPRPSTLEGKTVAQLWDQLFKGDVVFEILEESLKARFPGVKFVSWREFGSTHGGEEKEA